LSKGWREESQGVSRFVVGPDRLIVEIKQGVLAVKGDRKISGRNRETATLKTGIVRVKKSVKLAIY